jgi:hypothetical protein
LKRSLKVAFLVQKARSPKDPQTATSPDAFELKAFLMSPFSQLFRSLADFQAATSPEAFEEAAAKVVLPESPGNPTPPPTPIPTPTNSPVAPPGVTTKGTKKNVGAIVGGVVGGFCGLALIAGAVAFIVYQRKKGKRVSSAFFVLLSQFVLVP